MYVSKWELASPVSWPGNVAQCRMGPSARSPPEIAWNLAQRRRSRHQARRTSNKSEKWEGKATHHRPWLDRKGRLDLLDGLGGGVQWEGD